MKTASVAPRTESAPLMPHAHAMSVGRSDGQQPHAGRQRDAHQHARGQASAAIAVASRSGRGQPIAKAITTGSTVAHRTATDGDRQAGHRGGSARRPHP